MTWENLLLVAAKFWKYREHLEKSAVRLFWLEICKINWNFLQKSNSIGFYSSHSWLTQPVDLCCSTAQKGFVPPKAQKTIFEPFYRSFCFLWLKFQFCAVQPHKTQGSPLKFWFFITQNLILCVLFAQNRFVPLNRTEFCVIQHKLMLRLNY